MWLQEILCKLENVKEYYFYIFKIIEKISKLLYNSLQQNKVYSFAWAKENT